MYKQHFFQFWTELSAPRCGLFVLKNADVCTTVQQLRRSLLQVSSPSTYIRKRKR